MTNTGIEYMNKVIPNKSMIYHKNSRGKINEAEQTNLSDRIPGGGVYSTVTDMLRFGNAILNFSLIKESTFQMMIENPNLKTQGNGYGLGWYLYGENDGFMDIAVANDNVENRLYFGSENNNFTEEISELSKYFA